MMFGRLFLILLSMSLFGCAGNKTIGSLAGPGGGAAGVQVVQSGELPLPDRSDLIELNRPYLQTDAGGRISFPLAGIVEAAGRTPGELEQILAERLRGRFVRNPQVTVNLKETVSQVITVDGQVKEPGLYPVIGRMTLMRAVATAKGTADFAKLDDVVVFRTVKSQKMVALYNLKAIRRGYYDDPEVFANDVVVVGDSSARRIFEKALQVVPLLSTPLIYILTRN
jgi:polysaccharide biosynthesis/export protein